MTIVLYYRHIDSIVVLIVVLIVVEEVTQKYRHTQ